MAVHFTDGTFSKSHVNPLAVVRWNAPVGYDLEKYATQLTAMSDDAFKEAVAAMDEEYLSPCSGELLQWLALMPYDRILKVCNAKQANRLLCCLTGNAMRGWVAGGEAIRALRTMNDRLPFFLEVVEFSRDKDLYVINISELYRAHQGYLGNIPLKGNVPENILKIVEIEKDYRDKSFPLRKALLNLEEKRNSDLAQLLSPPTENKPTAALSELSQKV